MLKMQKFQKPLLNILNQKIKSLNLILKWFILVNLKSN